MNVFWSFWVLPPAIMYRNSIKFSFFSLSLTLSRSLPVRYIIILFTGKRYWNGFLIIDLETVEHSRWYLFRVRGRRSNSGQAYFVLRTRPCRKMCTIGEIEKSGKGTVGIYGRGLFPTESFSRLSGLSIVLVRRTNTYGYLDNNSWNIFVFFSPQSVNERLTSRSDNSHGYL